jgi:hypothetical protein
LLLKLSKTEAELDEANQLVEKQDDTITDIQNSYREKEREFSEREAALQQDKKDLEEHMVGVVVQQVREAKAKERNTVRDELEQEFDNKMGQASSAYEGRIAQLVRVVAVQRHNPVNVGDFYCGTPLRCLPNISYPLRRMLLDL